LAIQGPNAHQAEVEKVTDRLITTSIGQTPNAALISDLVIQHALAHEFSISALDLLEVPMRLLQNEPCISTRQAGNVSEVRPYKTGCLHLQSQMKPDGACNLTVQGYFPTSADAIAAFSEISDLLPPRESAQDMVPVHFWHWTDRWGPQRTVRHITAPKWTGIAENYQPRVASALSSTMELRARVSAGRVLLWRGEPGTGKTWALRALAREWKEWCIPHYIIDPDIFFSKAEYLIAVMTQLPVDMATDAVPSAQGSIPQDSGPVTSSRLPIWNLLILEDTGELIAIDAKQRTGQALSKLLNLGDGLLGQGLNVLTLITTNEDHGEIHPAISRQGRCVSNIAFGAFTSTEAVRWLRARACDANVSGDKTLADLYALLQDSGMIANEERKAQAGFINGARDAMR
jgi:hypothetical protein